MDIPRPSHIFLILHDTRWYTLTRVMTPVSTFGQIVLFPSSYPLFGPKISKCFSNWLWWNGDIVSSDFLCERVSSTSGKNAFLLFWKRKTQLLPNCLLLSPFRGPWVKGILGEASAHFHSCISAFPNMLHIVQRHGSTERLVMCSADGTFPSGF